MILSIQSVGFAIVLTDFSMGFQLITQLLDFLFQSQLFLYTWQKNQLSVKILKTNNISTSTTNKYKNIAWLVIA